jgi:3-hydroxyacyl-[acyl-carrier-protein] dehydratase
VRFHLIDRVDHVEPGVSVRGRKLTSRSEQYWVTTAEGPVMPSTLVLEALCQAGSWLLILSTDGKKRAALLSIETVRFTGTVRPGDVIELEGRVDSLGRESAVFSGCARVDGREVMALGHVMCALIDAAELESADETARRQLLVTRSGA